MVAMIVGMFFFAQVAAKGDAMIISNGKNDFRNNMFDKYRWSANTYETSEEIIACLRELGVFGKTVKGISAIGAITAYAPGTWKRMAVDVLRDAGIITGYKRKHLPFRRIVTLNDGSVHDLEDRFDLLKNVSIERKARLYEPLLILFEDGDVLELLPCAPKGLRIGFNSLPKNMCDGLNRREYDVGALFDPLVSGSNFSEVEIRSSVEKTTYSNWREEKVRKRNVYCIYFYSASASGWLHLDELQSSEYDLSFITYSSLEKIKCSELADLIPESHQETILEGYHNGGELNIFPTKGIGCDEAPYEIDSPENFSVCYDTPALYWSLLKKYFDPELPINKKTNFERRFDGYGWNSYTKETIIRMVEEVAAELERIRGLPPAEQEEALHSGRRLQTDEEMLIQIDEAISFTERFSERLLSMALYTPEYNYITLMGP